ncbi:MAG: BadF/BadG/BcrA/BcrD ATPase family protein [Candidatus Promineifilaceae bacterium]
MTYYLGVDLGATKSHTIIADEQNHVVGFGQAGPGNHQVIGYPGMLRTLRQGLDQALSAAGITASDICAAGFGVAGYDWPSQKPDMFKILNQLGLDCPMGLVNDGVPPLLAGATDGWGVALVSGTGCNCRGWDKNRQREGRVTGYGYRMGEFAGGSELVWRAMYEVANEWTKRGQPTAISTAFIKFAGAKNLADLIEGYTEGYYSVNAKAAPLIFEAAESGDAVAQKLIRWTGVELGEMAKAVIRQLEFEAETFDVVLSGSLFKGGRILIDPLWETISQLAPNSRLVHLAAPPVIGSVILAMEQVGRFGTAEVRQSLNTTLEQFYSAG